MTIIAHTSEQQIRQHRLQPGKFTISKKISVAPLSCFQLIMALWLMHCIGIRIIKCVLVYVVPTEFDSLAAAIRKHDTAHYIVKAGGSKQVFACNDEE